LGYILSFFIFALRIAACKRSLARLAQRGRGVFSAYGSSVLNSLMYLLKDCLERLADIHNVEVAMADKAAWERLPPRCVPCARICG
jgi:Ubiquitin elongating factor core